MTDKLPQNLRRSFADILYQEMLQNEDIWVIVADLGYRMWDQIRASFPGRFVNAGASEQAMMGLAIGLALQGKIPVVYSITTFLLYRPFETIRNYINFEKIPVKLVGSGRDKDYAHDGISHWALEDKEVLKIFSNIEGYWPNSAEELPKIISKMIKTDKPFYINLRR